MGGRHDGRARPAGRPTQMTRELALHASELLAPLGAVRTRRMFGGWGLYVDGVFLALIADATLYLKADAASQPRFEAAGCEPFVYDSARGPVRLGYWTAPQEAMESAALMQPWARLALAAALRARSAQAARRSPKARRSQPAARQAAKRPRQSSGRA